MSGKVYLAGAGLGDPELITVKGLRLLQTADVIVYDRLAHPDHLQAAKTDALLIDVGKSSDHTQAIIQAEIDAILLDQAIAENVKAPTVVIVGEAVNFHEKINWFQPYSEQL